MGRLTFDGSVAAEVGNCGGAATSAGPVRRGLACLGQLLPETQRSYRGLPQQRTPSVRAGRGFHIKMEVTQFLQLFGRRRPDVKDSGDSGPLGEALRAVVAKTPAKGFLKLCAHVGEAEAALDALLELVTGYAPPSVASDSLSLLLMAVDEPECCRMLGETLDATRRLTSAFLHNHSTASAPTAHAESVSARCQTWLTIDRVTAVWDRRTAHLALSPAPVW